MAMAKTRLGIGIILMLGALARWNWHYRSPKARDDGMELDACPKGKGSSEGSSTTWTQLGRASDPPYGACVVVRDVLGGIGAWKSRADRPALIGMQLGGRQRS